MKKNYQRCAKCNKKMRAEALTRLEMFSDILMKYMPVKICYICKPDFIKRKDVSMNHQRREALSKALSTVGRSIEMLETYLDIKVEEIHTTKCAESKGGICNCYQEVYSSGLGDGFRGLNELFENLKHEIEE